MPDVSDIGASRPLSRFAIGFFCIYFLLEWVPWTLIGVGIQYPFDLLTLAGQWPITHLLHLPEHSSSTSGGDFLVSYLAAAVTAVASIVLSTMWLLLDQSGRTQAYAFPWLHTLVRYMLASSLLGYGWHKILPGQFGRMTYGAGTDYLIHQVGQLAPRDLFWAFMEGSRLYQVFTGLVETAAGTLLLMPRTRMLGAMLGIAAMTNVLMLDIGYDVVVKFSAGQTLLMALLVMAPYAKGFSTAITPAGLGPRIRLPFLTQSTANGVARVLAVLFATVLTVWAVRFAQSTVATNRDIARTPVHGIWDVDEITRNDVPVPLLITDQTLWRRLVFPFAGTDAGAILVWASDAVTRCNSRIDVGKKTIDLNPLADSKVIGSIRGAPRLTSADTWSFTFDTVANDRLVLRRNTPNGGSEVIRLRKFDPAGYQLLSYTHGWIW